MRVNLLSFHGALNYGAVWQVYSLSKVLNNLDADVRLVDLRLPWDWPPVLSPLGIKELFHPIARRKRRLFRSFLNEYLPPRTQLYRRPGQLAGSPPAGDIFIVGSDQVWNPQHTRQYCLDFFFHPMASKGKRISYGASFGSNSPTFTPHQRQQISEALRKFDYVSVREQSGVEICRSLGCKNALQVVDPIFLAPLSELQRFCYNSFCGGKKIVCYKFYQNSQLLDCLAFVSEKMGQEAVLLHVPSASLYLRGITGSFPDRMTEDRVSVCWCPSPQQWLAALAESSFVFTDSFHGMAFAVRFKKDFLVLMGNRRRFSRIREFLEQVNLENRIFYSYTEVVEDTRWKEHIDFDEVYKLLSPRIEFSMNFLQLALR